MDVSNLQVKFIRGYESRVTEEGKTQKDKILPYLSVVYPYKGEHEVAIEDDKLTTIHCQTDCFLVGPQVRHTIVHHLDEDGNVMIPRWIFMTVLYRQALDVTAWFRLPLHLSGDAAMPFIRAVDEMQGTPDAFTKLRVAGTVLEQLCKVGDFQPAMGQLDAIYPAVALMGDRCAEDLTVEELAKSCGMSPASFHRAFRSATGKTPMQYLNEQRLNLAARLVTEGRRLSQIAAQCGFCDEFHLSRNFKKHYGASPREYRRRTEL